MNGPSIPVVKRVIRAVAATEARALVDRLLTLTYADDIEREVREEMTPALPRALRERLAARGSAELSPCGGGVPRVAIPRRRDSGRPSAMLTPSAGAEYLPFSNEESADADA